MIVKSVCDEYNDFNIDDLLSTILKNMECTKPFNIKQNGVTERRYHTLMDIVKSILVKLSCWNSYRVKL